MEPRSPADLVLALVRVINADAPRRTAQDLLDPMVQIRMDEARHCGILTWYRWIRLIRHCGRVSELRLTDCRTWPDPEHPDIVHLSGRWSGTICAGAIRRTSAGDVDLRYRIRDGRIGTIWTRKSNYEFIFGRWIRYPLGYWLFLGWAYFYFELLSFQKIDFITEPS